MSVLIPYRTSDFEGAREHVERILRPRYLLHQSIGSAADVRFVSYHEDLSANLRIARIEYGVPLEVDLGRPDHYYLCVPLQGRARFRILDAETTLHVGQALFVAPSAYLRGYVDEYSERLLVQLDRNAVEDFFDRTNATADRCVPNRFLNLHSDAAKPLAQLLEGFARRLAGVMSMTDAAASANDCTNEFDRLIAALWPLIDPFTRDIAARPSRSELIVYRIEAYMRRHCTDGVALDDVSREFGLSRRSLQLAFQSARPYGPLSYLRRIQLESARIELFRRDGDATSVTEIATEFGFSHFGRFSKTYRTSFGESPSATIRRRRLEEHLPKDRSAAR